MILIDTHVFIYAAGRPHPRKGPSTAFLERVARGEIEAGVDAEVLQEILHRYRAIGRWAEGKALYQKVRAIVPTVLPVTAALLDDALGLLDAHPKLSSQDALHAAACRSVRAAGFCSYDQDFDGVAGLRRLSRFAEVD